MYGGDHVLIAGPFAMEDGGTLGAYDLERLKSLASEYADVAAQGCYSPQLQLSLNSRVLLLHPARPMQVSL